MCTVRIVQNYISGFVYTVIRFSVFFFSLSRTSKPNFKSEFYRRLTVYLLSCSLQDNIVHNITQNIIKRCKYLSLHILANPEDGHNMYGQLLYLMLYLNICQNVCYIMYEIVLCMSVCCGKQAGPEELQRYVQARFVLERQAWRVGFCLIDEPSSCPFTPSEERF